MKDLIIALEIVKSIAKDLHYNSKGELFYAIHLMMDRIADPINGYIDSLKEIGFMARGVDAPRNQEIYLEVASTLQDKQSSEQELQDALKFAIYAIEQAARTSEAQEGDKNLLGEISQHLMLSLGLIVRTFGEPETKEQILEKE